jgi:hypothetical protein
MWMSVEELESAIAGLPPEQFARLATWFAEYQAEQWDRQIEQDLRQGRLDAVIRQAREDVAAGRSKPL